MQKISLLCLIIFETQLILVSLDQADSIRFLTMLTQTNFGEILSFESVLTC